MGRKRNRVWRQRAIRWTVANSKAPGDRGVTRQLMRERFERLFGHHPRFWRARARV